MPCKTHRGPRGGRFIMKRKKGGGTTRKYFPGRKEKKRYRTRQHL